MASLPRFRRSLHAKVRANRSRKECQHTRLTLRRFNVVLLALDLRFGLEELMGYRIVVTLSFGMEVSDCGESGLDSASSDGGGVRG